MAFAIRHADRCAALIPLVPAAYAPNRPPARPFSPMQQALVEALLNSDFLFWSAAVGMPDIMIRTLLGTDPELVRAASPTERDRVYGIMKAIMPVTRRSRGLRNDARLAGKPSFNAACVDHRAYPGHFAQGRPLPDRGRGASRGRDEELFDTIDAFLKKIGYA